MADPSVPKSEDEEGWPTVAKYSRHALTSARNLDHERKIRSEAQVEARPDELRGIARGLLQTGQLQSHTGVFDTTELPVLPGFARLGCAAAAPSKATCFTL